MNETCRAAAFFFLALTILAPGQLLAGYAEGVEAFKNQDLERAEQEFRSAIEVHPDYAGAHLMLGRTLLGRGESAEALASLERAVELEPGAALNRYFLGRAQLGAGHPEAALDALSGQPLAEVPEQVREAYAAALARSAEETGGAAGLTALEEAVTELPDSALLWLGLGRLHRAADRSGEAFTATERAFALDGSNPALGRLAVQDAFAAAQGEEAEEDRDARKSWYRRGAEVAERLARAHPEAESWSLLGEARLGSGDCAAAVEAFRKADAGDPRVRYYLGTCSVTLGEPDQALVDLQAALESGPDEGLERRIHAGIGAAYRHQEEFERAADAYRKAGDAAKVAEMEALAEAARINRGIEARREACRERQAALEGLVAESRDLQGTPEFGRLRASWHDLRFECADVLEIPAFPEG